MANLYRKNASGSISPVWYDSPPVLVGLSLLVGIAFMTLYLVLAGFGVDYSLLLWLSLLLLASGLVIGIALVIPQILRLKKLGFKTYFKVLSAENAITKGLIDVLAVNSMKTSSFIKVPNIAVAPSDRDNEKSWLLEVEKLAGMRDVDLVSETVDSCLVGDWKSFAVVEASQDQAGNFFIFKIENVNLSKKIIVTHLSQLEPEKAYKLKCQQGLSWDLSKAPHALIAGDSGSGKTAILMTFLTQLLAGGASIKVVDPKSEFLFLENILPSGSVVRDFDCVLSLLKSMTEEMTKRNEIIAKEIKSRKSLGLTGADLGMEPTILVIDEVASLVAGVDRKQLQEFIGYLTKIVQMGRSSLTNVILTTQQPNAQVISTAIRDQLSFRILMGKPSPELKRMVFGDGVDLESDFIERYTGFYVMSGETREPLRYFGIDLFTNNFANVGVFEKCYKRGQIKQFNDYMD